MNRPKKPNRPKELKKLLQLYRRAGNQIFVDKLVRKIEAKIKKKPGWQNLRVGEDYDVDSGLRLQRFHEKLLQEEAELKKKPILPAIFSRIGKRFSRKP